MSVEKTKEQLLKQISLFNDFKKNSKYLVYFSGGSASSIRMNVTNGVDVWCKNLNDEKLLADIGGLKLDDLIGCLLAALRETRYELNKVLDFADTDSELVEFSASHLETANGATAAAASAAKRSSFKILMEPAKSNASEIKSFLFNMHDRMCKAEDELKRLNSKHGGHHDQHENGVTSSSSSNDLASLSSGENNFSGLKRFSIQSSAQAAAFMSRKPGMSIMNPKSKRRKTPKGVEFDEDEEDSECSNGGSGSASDEKSRKFVRNLSSQSDC